jgi:hypothetical protein
MLGAALFGAAGALLAIPVAALLLALLDIYARKYELLPELVVPAPTERDVGDRRERRERRVTRGRQWVSSLVRKDEGRARTAGRRGLLTGTPGGFT